MLMKLTPGSLSLKHLKNQKICKPNTIILGYNDYGNNNFTAVMNKIYLTFLVQFGHFTTLYTFTVITKSKLLRTDIDGPIEFVITEFDCSMLSLEKFTIRTVV